MQCPECGFDIDEMNESQPLCPRCGADPFEPAVDDIANDPSVQDGLAILEQIKQEDREREQLEKGPQNDLIN